ncbi:hypothetical protein OH76DRAFT_1398723 [Lentinus brumalis]|uniref:Uncharacterized protein n=1 Tax=Lentinus brumalis TaxID=2498619 RepID=A0A371DM33_9APHY|nr:hypothetical protein OH76DRAFT_1398723 [Polyporus brumalis]
MASEIDAIVDEFDSVFGLLAEPPVEEGDLKLDTPEQRKLREQIAFHVAQATKLKRELNSRNPAVTRLPPEILAEVFLWQAAILRKERVALHEAKGDGDIHQSFYKWLNVSQVCHHWRDVALNCVNLWTWIAFEERIKTWYIRDLVKRARGLPLTVVLTINSPGLHCDSCLNPDTFYHNGSCALDFVKELLPRIRELSIFIEKDFDIDEIWESFEGPAPLLEALHVEAMSGTRFEQGDREPATVNLPKALFGLQAPKLRSLYVGGIRIHLSSPLFGASLRKLTIVSCQCSPLHVTPAFAQWQSMLRRMPELEELDVDWSVPSGSDGEIYGTVSLPNLKELRIRANVDAFVCHATHLKIPSTATIHHHFNSRPFAPPSEVSLAQLNTAIASLFKDLSTERIAYRDHEHPTLEEYLASCQIWAIPRSQRDAKPAMGTLVTDSLAILERPPRLTIESESKPVIEALASSALSALDMSSVHTVEIGDFSTGNRWAQILRGARNLQLLRAHGITAFGVPAILAKAIASNIEVDPADEFLWAGFLADDGLDKPGGRKDEDTDMTKPALDGTNAKSTLLFPNLTVLDFVDVDLEVPAGTYPPHGFHADVFTIMRFQANEAKYGLSIEAILKCLCMRRAQGAADIASVQFHKSCCADMAQLAPLVEAVPDVYWDGNL